MAPQIYYDSGNSNYLVYWSTRIGTGGYLDIYKSTTTDFTTFTTPTLFYTRGATHTLDADIVKDTSTNNYTMFLAGTVKAQGGTDLYGPYSTSVQQLTSGYNSEGPSGIKIGNNWIVYNDHYSNGVYGAVISSDNMQTWSDYTGNVSFPSGTRHGNVFTVPRSVANYLIAHAPNVTSEIEFDNQTTGTQDYLSASNWVGGTVPGTGRIAIIQNGQTATISSSTSGSPTEIWAGENSAGTMNITGGTVNILSTGWLCSGRNNGSAGSVINLSGGTVNTGNVSTGSVQTTASGTINISNNATLAITSNMYNGETGTGSIVQSGTSTVTAGGSISLGRWSTGNGSYSISGGTLSQTNTGQRLIVGEQGTGTLTVSGTGLVNSSGGVRISASSTGNGQVHLDGGTIYTPLVEDSGGTSAFHFNGGTLKAKNATTTFMQGLNSADIEAGGAVIDTNGYNITIAQPLLAAPTSGGLTKQNAGILTLSTSPTYGGATIVSGGTLLLGTSVTLPTTTALNLTASGATLDTSGNSQTIASLTGVAGSEVKLGSGTLTTGNSTSTIFAGAITSSTGGSLIKQGAGTLTLSGTNTFTGSINFNGGLIKAASLNNLGSGIALNFNSGGLQFDGVYDPSARTMTFQSGGAIIDTQANNIILAGAIGNSGAGGLSKNGSGTLTLSGTITYTGDTFINDGALQLLTGTTSLDDISGTGRLLVGGTATSKQLTASSINLGGLYIGPGSKLIIRPTEDLAGTQQLTTPVPEPSLWILLIFAAAAGWPLYGRRSR